METDGVFEAFLGRVKDRLETGWLDLVHGGLYVAQGAPDHEGHYRDGVWRNWTDSYGVRPAAYHLPATEADLREIVAKAVKLRVVGGGHTFNDSPLSDDTIISLDDYDSVLRIDPDAGTIRVQAGIRLRDLNRVLRDHGLGLPVLGSTDAQSIAGLVATDLHGTGRDHGFLSEQILALRVIAHDGTVRDVRPGDPLFHAVIGGLGTCGVVAEVELQAVQAFNLEKSTRMMDRAATEDEVDAVLQANDHVSFYYIGGADEGESFRMHCWRHTDAAVTPDWEKIKTRAELADFAISAFLPGIAAALADMDEDAWLSDVLAPDQRLVLPGSHGFGRKLFYRHDEIEFGVPFPAWRACVAEILALLRARSFFSVVEVRFTPDASRALLGPGVGRRTAYIELATPMSQQTDAVYAEAEDILRAYGGQPHLGKKTTFTAGEMRETYGERYVTFARLRGEQDPGGKFLNAFTERVLGT
ncbi:MAG: D-arabinono-1,4-lactone oxidase [Pseudomonadota bacterium]|nr:D-arabinono-1,4-lactone oxidase [Pseudomonadota bacterium]